MDAWERMFERERNSLRSHIKDELRSKAIVHLTRNINPDQSPINDWVDLGNGIIAHRYGILTTSIVAYAVYEPSKLIGNHSTITHTDECGWLGDITTRHLPAELEALRPGSQERIDAVTAYLDGLKQQAEAIIHSAFPQDFREVA